MTLPVQDRKAGPYTGTGSLTVFPYNFRIENAADLEVYVADVLTTAYAVSGVGQETGGTITLDVAPAPGAIVWIFGNQPVEQQDVKLVTGGEIRSTNLELSLDKYVMMMQERLVDHERAVLLRKTTTLRGVQFPDPIPLHVIQWNANGDGLDAAPAAILQVTIDPVSGWANGKTTTVVPSVDNAAAITIPAAIPSGVEVQHASFRVTVTYGNTKGLTTVSFGEPMIQDAWAAGLNPTVGFFTVAGQRRRAAPFVSATTLPLVLTAESGLFDATGEGKATVHWSTYLADA